MTTDERRSGAPGARPAGARPAPRGRRASKRLLRAGAWVLGGVAFALPWAAVAATPHPVPAAQSAGQVLVIPAGTKVIYQGGGPAGATVASGSASAGPAHTSTGGSAPP